VSRRRVAPPAGSVRCAIYTRKSTSHGLDQEFNSLDAQYEFCASRIKDRARDSWHLLPERYDDGGYTGANTDRPAFQRLMRDVDAGKVDVIVVYKLDRLCRSLRDFVKLMERLNRAGVRFVSVTQPFSTDDAVGRMTLNQLMTFAEFERDMASERTRDKVHGARRRGKWTGGIAPIGYRVDAKLLVIDEATAPLAHEIFDLYVEWESAVAVAVRLNESAPRFCARNAARGTAKPRRWTKNDVLRILQNPIYAGLISCGEQLYDGAHNALIPRDKWQRVQAIIEANRRSGRQRPRNLRYFLRGVLRCAECGAAMTPAPTRRAEREYRYYRCVTRDKGGKAACAAPSLAADSIEGAVEVELRRLSVEPSIQEEALVAARARLNERREALASKRASEVARQGAMDAEAGSLASRLAACEVGAHATIERRIAELHDQRHASEQRRHAFDADLTEVALAIERLDSAASIITTIDRVWPRLTPASRGRLVRTLVERVEVSPAGQVRIELVSGGLGSMNFEGARDAA
jgi:DNA invertase Pin-like site-specific DNA recombinase